MTSPALLGRLAGETQTLCTLVTITRRDGRVFGFTDLDCDIEIGGINYRAGTFTPSSISSAGDLSVANLDVQTLLDPAVITVPDLIAGLWNFARIRYEQVDFSDLSLGARVLLAGTTGEVKAGQVGFSTELRSLAQSLQSPVGETSTARCRADLGDARCGVDLAPLRVTGSVTSVDAGNRRFGDSARTEPGPAGPVAVTGISTAQYAVVTAPAHGKQSGQVIMLTGVAGMTTQTYINNQLVTGTASINGSFATVRSVPDAKTLVLNIDTRGYSAYAGGGQLQTPGNVGTFDAGQLVWTSGANAGRGVEIKTYAPGFFVLAAPMPYPIAVGDAYAATPGCGKRAIEDCAGRYANIIRFRGEPYRPGMDALIKAAGV